LKNTKNLKIKEIAGDGNCLYRAFADQLYGNESNYEIVKNACFDYIEIEKPFFSQFIEGGLENFDYYVAMKRRDGVWGDDVEIQALSEIYCRNVEIFSHSLEPLKTFHENEDNNLRRIERKKDDTLPIRLSYHGRAHYNSIVPTDINQYKEQLIQTYIGKYESKALEQAKLRVIEKEEADNNEIKKVNTEKIDININDELVKDNIKIEGLREHFIEKGR